MKIRKVFDERFGVNDIDFIFNNGIVKFMFGGNLDLTFYVISEEEGTVNFIISPDDMEVFTLFNELYNKAINCDVKDKKFIRSTTYKKLFEDGYFSWKSEDQVYEDANQLNIYKEDNCYRLEFVLKNIDFATENAIRIQNSGCRYKPFNTLFLDLYNKLQNIPLVKDEEKDKALNR